jgi:hypothetical protein
MESKAEAKGCRETSNVILKRRRRPEFVKSITTKLFADQ